ncbi:MAG TPA: hypothetical protein VGC09_22285 [Rhodopila sp.]
MQSQYSDVDPDAGRPQPCYDENEARIVAGLFDPAYYLAANPDVRESKIDPLAHFLSTGWREGRNPSPDFNVAYYLKRNADVAASGINPLIHYAWAGAKEGRLPRRPLDAMRGVLESLRPPSARAGDWVPAIDPTAPLDRSVLARRLASVIAAGSALAVSVSHDDYERNFGGVQNVIRHEQIAFRQMHWSYLHLSPAVPLPILAGTASAADFRFSIRLGNDWLGVARATDLIACLTELGGNDRMILLIVHHFLGHAPEVLRQLAQVAADPVIVWTHDYFTLCPSFNLLRNDVRFCGAPPVVSAACGICAYGPERVDHLTRIRGFFDAVRPVVLAPSAAALDLWERKADLPYREAHVRPLARLTFAPGAPRPTRDDPTQPIRVAHVGMRTVPKGWPIFQELAQRFARHPDYAFFQLGTPRGVPLPGSIRNIEVQTSREQPDAMIEAIAAHAIDVVVSWSLWPETFCLAAHEALAAGAFVVARRGAGHIATAIETNAPEQGHVVQDEASLFALFEDGGLKRLLATAQRRRGVLIAESGSTPWARRSFRDWDRLRSEQPAVVYD